MTPAPAGGDTLDGAALRAGTRVQEYDIRRVLGGGGFGITYLAHDTHLNLPVALKEFFPGELVSRASDGRVLPRTGEGTALKRFTLGVARFVEEARTLAALRHPHIVRVLRYFQANGTAYIVMEYERGQSLKRWLPGHAPLTQATLLAIILPLLDGLEAVHAAGFLHRDIKPDNIYVRDDGSPVLLDFGAARRVQPHGEMTNIVSPGFAPFEQYHAQGDQGPWTDLYSLGAVMYWMVTGTKPLEAASRIRHDGLRPASALADPAVFSASLLQAIDFALQPQERHRPQCVADLRSAIRGSPSGDATAAMTVPSAPFAPGPDAALGHLPRGNLLATVLFLDLVDYSARSVDDQVAIKRRLNDCLARALAETPPAHRVAIDTGDGAALCFLADPEEALHAGLRLRELLADGAWPTVQVRMGLNLGPVRIIPDINNRINVIGDGINAAQRVMDFARPGQVLASRAYHDVIARIADGTARMFRYLGPHQDKHGRMHEVHAVLPAQRRAAASAPLAGFDHTVPADAAPQADDPAIHGIEADLARRIGPMARVLVAKARRRAPSMAALRTALAPLIPDLAAREAFLAGRDEADSRTSRTVTASGTASGAKPTPRARQPGAFTAHWQAPPDDALALLEQALSRQIGPMARLLLRQQLECRATPSAMVDALCAQIDAPASREAFRALAQRVLRRP